MAEIDFQSILDGMSVDTAPSDPIQSIYKIMPVFDSVQMEILFQVYYFIEKWGLSDLDGMFKQFAERMANNKSLSFMSSKTLKDLLGAYTQNEMIRGISVRASSNDSNNSPLG